MTRHEGRNRAADKGIEPDDNGADATSLWIGHRSLQGNGPHRPVKTAETVATKIVRDVVERKLKPGDKLPPEAAMLSTYGVSRASLREALRLLEVQGLIRLKPGPGGGPALEAVDPRSLAQITSLYLHLGGGTYRQLFEAQLQIAPMAVRMAAANPDRDLVAARLGPYLDTQLPVDDPQYASRTGDFHTRIEELTGNRVIELMARIISQLWNVHVASRMDTTPFRQAILDEHRAIARAVVKGQESRAAKLMYDHYQQLQSEFAERRRPDFEELLEWG